MGRKGGWVYILASRRNGTLYIGVTADLATRHWQHTHGQGSEFAERYGVMLLVYYEFHEDIGSAILREKQMKKWNREWKLRLIEGMNPQWKDLSFSLNQ